MEWLEIIFYILTGVSLLCALLLSGTGYSNGLNQISSAELELFKITKDRGFVKWLQIFLFSVTIILIAIAILLSFI